MDKINKMASGQVPFNGTDVYDKLDELVEWSNKISELMKSVPIRGNNIVKEK